MRRDEGADENRGISGDLFRVVVVVGFALVLMAVLHSPVVRESVFDVHSFRMHLQAEHTVRQGLLSRLTFLCVTTALIGLGLPRIYVSGAAGFIYGALEGTLLGLVASLAGSTIAYALGRSLLAHVAERRLVGRASVWRARFQENGFWWTLYGRLIPFANSFVMNLICGLCRIPLSQFLLASAIGFVPLGTVAALVGSGSAKRSPEQIALAAALLIVAIIAERTARMCTAPSPGPGDVQGPT